MNKILGINESLGWLVKQNTESFTSDEVSKLTDYFGKHKINLDWIKADGQYIHVVRALEKGTVYLDITQENLKVSLEIVKTNENYFIRAHYPEKNNGGGGALFGTIGDNWNSRAYVCESYDSFMEQLDAIMLVTKNLKSAPRKIKGDDKVNQLIWNQ